MEKFRGYIIRLFDKNDEEFDSLSIHDIDNIKDLNKEIIDYDLEYNDEFYDESINAEKIIIEKFYY